MRCKVETLILYVLSTWKLSSASPKLYADTWAVEVDGGEEAARALARKHGFIYVNEIMPRFYSFRHNKVAKRSIYGSGIHHEKLAQEPQVRWLEQQVVKRRVKRDIHFNDPKWDRMWYMNRPLGGNMSVERAWTKGYTGKNVVVTILDDGIETDHPDLKENYDANASYDVNGNDYDPTPRLEYTNENRHGTRCAGEVAAVANNNICSVGVAFEARIGGVRMLDGDVTDSVEAKSLSLNRQYIQVYSASWGPDDDGKTVDGPAYMAKKAFYNGVTTGRGGLGSIFVWASGNGGRDGDSCNCDGYTNSIYTLSISSATEHGNIPWYSEACSSTLATTFSSGSGGERQIITTDLRKGCTETHTGTSASAPLAAGICALALHANPRLTWRDMQHIVVRTATPDHLQASDWDINGVNRRVSHSFGYGLLDASAMVDLALNWTTVPAQHACTVRSTDTNVIVPVNGRIQLKLETDACKGRYDQVVYLEHVQAKISLSSNRRGEVQIFLTSPMKTRSTLLARRTRDLSKEGFNNWDFMTVHNWGEFARGTWLLEIANGDSTCELKTWSLVLHGTETNPQRNNKKPNVSSSAASPTTASSFIPFDIDCLLANKERHCLACKPGFFLLTESCIKTCPVDFAEYTEYVDLKNGTKYAARVCKVKVIWNFIDVRLLGFYMTSIALCISSVLVFCAVFFILESRDHNLLCFRRPLENLDFDWSEKAKYSSLQTESDSDDDFVTEFDKSEMSKSENGITSKPGETKVAFRPDHIFDDDMVTISLNDTQDGSTRNDHDMSQPDVIEDAGLSDAGSLSNHLNLQDSDDEGQGADFDLIGKRGQLPVERD